MTVTLMPYKKEFQISHIFNTEDQRVKYAKPGENVRLKVKNIEEVDIKRGFMNNIQWSSKSIIYNNKLQLTDWSSKSNYSLNNIKIKPVNFF